MSASTYVKVLRSLRRRYRRKLRRMGVPFFERRRMVRDTFPELYS